MTIRSIVVIVCLLLGFLIGLPGQSFPAAGNSAATKPGLSRVDGNWDKLVAAAQKEGTVSIYGNLPPVVKNKLVAAFKAKYGINVEILVGRPAELVNKVRAERRNNIYAVDIGFFGGTSITNDLKPMGICQPLEPLFMLPEIKDPKTWRGGRVPYLDEDKTAFILVMMANSFYQRNINLVKENEITSREDLLNPKWKDKLALGDPSISGAANAWFTWMLTEVMGKEKGLQFMKELVKQRPAITRDERQLVEWVARGKYVVSIGPLMSIPAEFIQMGAPIAFLDIKEPRSLSPASGIINVFKNAPHPNAAKLFLNWIVTKEGNSQFALAEQYPSLRVDVSPEGILPIMWPRPGDVFPDWKYSNFKDIQGAMRKVAAEVFAPLLK